MIVKRKCGLGRGLGNLDSALREFAPDFAVKIAFEAEASGLGIEYPVPQFQFEAVVGKSQQISLRRGIGEHARLARSDFLQQRQYRLRPGCRNCDS